MNTIPFALRGDQIITITEAERGLQCNCTCMACGSRLIAKKGARHAHHFAHYKGQACEHGLETALHRRIKTLFEQRRSINLPPIRLHRQKGAYLPAKRFQYSAVEEERKLGRLQPDLLLRAGNKVLLVEIAVTHRSPPEKLVKLRRLGYAAIEIDALALYESHCKQPGQPDIQGFERGLFLGLSFKRWLFNPQQQRAEYRLRKLAIQRSVKHRRYKGFHQYIVEGCPLGKRRWRSGFRQGQAFANVIQDCMHCERCIHLEYEQAYVGYQSTPLLPKTVHCWGHLEERPKGRPWQSVV